MNVRQARREELRSVFANAPIRAGQAPMFAVRRFDLAGRNRRLANRSTTAGNASHATTRNFKENTMSLGTILLLVLILMLIGAIPGWPHSRNWGYGPSGGLGLVAVIVIVLLLMGRL